MRPTLEFGEHVPEAVIPSEARNPSEMLGAHSIFGSDRLGKTSDLEILWIDILTKRYGRKSFGTIFLQIAGGCGGSHKQLADFARS
jgi:hypothetical protein